MSTPRTITPSLLSVWLLAFRPKTLPASMVPVFVGSAVAHRLGAFALLPALSALFGAMAIQIGTNLVNDASDFERGADTEARLGPARAVASGWLSPRAVWRAAAVAFAVAVLAGLHLVTVGGWPIVWIGLASIASGIAYTAGPFPLAYLGLGDLFVVLFFGFVAVAGTVFVQAGEVPALALWAAVPVGALSTAILVVNNVRDRAQDVLASKKTLVVRFGRAFGGLEYCVLLASAFLVPCAMFALEPSQPYVLLPMLCAPWAFKLALELHRREGPLLNDTLASTARLMVVHGALFTLGIAQ